MKRMSKLLALVLICAPMLMLGGCVIALGNRGTVQESPKAKGCGCAKATMLVSPDGKCWTVSVDNDGQLITKPAPCKGTAGCKCGKGSGCQCGGKTAASAQTSGCGSSAKPMGGCKMMMGAQGGSPMTEPIPTVNIGGEANK